MGKANFHKKMRQVQRKSMKDMAQAMWDIKPWYISRSRWNKVIFKLMNYGK